MTTRVIQRTPNIGMALKLRRPSAGAACPCDLTGAAWGTMFPRSHGEDPFSESSRQEYSQTPLFNEFGELDGFPDPYTIYQTGRIAGIPRISMWGTDSPHYYLGIPLGDSGGVVWSWSITPMSGLSVVADDTEGGWKGPTVAQEGAFLSVWVEPGNIYDAGGSLNGWYPLYRVDATATCPGGSSASIWLELGVTIQPF